MKHTISELTEVVHIVNFCAGAKGNHVGTLTITNVDGKSRFDFRFDKDGIKVSAYMDEKGRLTFERLRRGFPPEYLQRDLGTGIVAWNEAKPYRSSGREAVSVELGLDLVLGG